MSRFSSGALLLVQVGYKFFWFMVWDSTYDPLEYLWLFFPILAACFAGAILVFALPGHKLWVGFGYAFLVSGLLVGVTSLAGQVDFRQLTAARESASARRSKLITPAKAATRKACASSHRAMH